MKPHIKRLFHNAGPLIREVYRLPKELKRGHRNAQDEIKEVNKETQLDERI